LLAFGPATDLDLLDHGSHPDTTAVDAHGDPFARHLAAQWQLAAPEPHQVAGAGRQDLRPEFVGDPPDRLLVQLQAATSQLGARLLDRQQSDEPPDFGLHVRAGPLADPVGRQLRLEPTPLAASSLTGAPAG